MYNLKLISVIKLVLMCNICWGKKKKGDRKIVDCRKYLNQKYILFVTHSNIKNKNIMSCHQIIKIITMEDK